MEIWYLDTSAINYFVKSNSIEDTLATKQLQLNKGREWRISPINLWEILMTSDEQTRNNIIFYCQCLFSKKLLPSPGELIIPYIEQGMPRAEKVRELVSNTTMARKWKDLVDDRKDILAVDHQELTKRVKLMQAASRDIHKIIKKDDLLLESSESFAGTDLYLSHLVNELPFIKAGEPVTKEDRKLYKVSLYYILLILCAEADLDNKVINDFWLSKGINSTIDRIFYVVRELPTLVHRGPFCLMTYMTIAQASEKFSRGLWYDSLHSIYLSYVDKFFTNDDHFKGFRKVVPEGILKMKIHHMDEVTVSHHPYDQFGIRAT